MARIPLLQETDPTISEESRDFLAQAAKARGKMLNLYRALANRPGAGRALSELIRTVYRSGSSLPRKDAELAYLTATVVNNCYY
jgi:alkylhydroperoxidase family enzyme